jgi:6-pyruvoyl-tetrahydropterin synthase
MSEEENMTGSDQVQESVQEAVGKNEDISEAVRKITVDALSRKSLDYDSIRSTIRDVLEGAKMGAKDDGKVKAAFQQVTSGLDEALAQSAEASKLAIEETAGRIKDFSKQDLKRALDELSGLEDLFIETISEAAKSSKGVVSETFTDLVNHAKNSGTVVGKRIADDVGMLRNKLGQSGKEQASELTDAAKTFSANVASAASGFLAGIAEALQDSGKK